MRTSSPSLCAWISASGSGRATTRDDAAVFQRQTIAVTQGDGLRQIQHHLIACFGLQADAAAVAAVIVDQHAIDLA